MQSHSHSNPLSRALDANLSRSNPSTLDAVHSQSTSSNAITPNLAHARSRITALSVEFVAKPNEAHKIHTALPAAIDGALGEVAAFAGSFVMIANYEARLVTVVTLWSGEDRVQSCNENLRWVRALLAPYLDRCLRVQTLAAYGPVTPQRSQPFEQPCAKAAFEPSTHAECDEQAFCVV
jgi:hypothetical protein